MTWVLVAGALLLLWVAYDLVQTQHAILRNFPIIGHFRYWLEAIGPELRQYIVTGNDEERPFSRDQRRWVYASAKKAEQLLRLRHRQRPRAPPNYLIIKHAAFPFAAPHPGEPGFDPELPAARARKVLGAARGPTKAFRPASVVNISGMSFGSLSGAGGRGAQPRRRARAAACTTPAKAASRRHHHHGGELIWQIGTGYFGCRDADGRFDLERFLETRRRAPGAGDRDQAQPGREAGSRRRPAGGEGDARDRARSAASRSGEDCISPPRHSAFPRRRRACSTSWSGSPRRRGCRSASSRPSARSRSGASSPELMARTDRGVDFITIDGGEGGTGAAPLVFADHVALPVQARLRPRLSRCSPSAGLHRARSCSSAPAGSASRSRRCWPGAGLRHDQRRAARRCCRSAASRPSAATPATARPAWRRRTAG